MQTANSARSSATARGGGLWSTPLPLIGYEISHSGVSVARWSRRSALLDGVSWRPLAPGALEASPLRENIQRPAEVEKALGDALRSVGIDPGAASRRPMEAFVVIPDQAARLSVLSFETFPKRASEGLLLVKWRLKKSLPFDIESAAISYFVERSGKELQVVAVAAPRTVVGQYEAMAVRFGLRPKWVTLSTLAALELASAGAAEGPEGILVAKYSPPWFTTAILQGGMLRLFRTVGIAADGDGSLPVADALSSVYPSVAYFQDNFHGTLARAYLCGLGANSSAVAEGLERELDLKSGPLVPDVSRLAAAGGGTDADGYAAERNFASLAGIAREQKR
jgi:type IV pilus assembly protein PilM